VTARARRNVVLLVLDALRADAVEPFGAPPGSSPTLAELAKRGMAVAGVRSTASWTLPSHTAMFTGELARGLGLGQAPDQSPQGAAPVVRAQSDRLLATVLRRSGYETRGVTTNVWAGKASGFDTGFDEFIELDTSRHAQLGGGIRQRLRWDWEAVRARGDDGAAEAEASIGGWIEQLSGQPFFWFANLVECHSPYLPPRGFAGASLLTRLRAADEASRYLNFDSIVESWLGVSRVPERAFARMRQLYAASLRYVDDWVRRLLASLDRAGALESTLVVVCSDHGENLGEGGLMTHGLSLDERLLRVPLIAAGPGAAAFEGMASLAELPARIAAAVQLDDHPWSDGLLAGLPVAQWDPFELSEGRIGELIEQWGLGEEAVRRLTSPLTCAVAGRFKLVRGAEPSNEALYDLDADPLELAPLRDEGAMAARAGDKLAALRAAVNHPAVQATSAVTVEPDVLSPVEAEDIERKMRLLGYL
jgi:arylsulfatase A-like enzyme